MQSISKKLMIAAVIGVLAFGAAPARAAVPDGTMVDHNQVWPLMEWVEARTNVRVPALPIVTASGTRLKTTLGLQGVQAARAMAAYIPGQVILNHVVWNRESVRSTSYLVHELVHHAQFFSEKQYACNNAKEREAYTLQNQWLAEQGEPPIVSQRFIDEISSCETPA